MRKRLTSILLTLAMLVGLLPALSPQAKAAADDATALLQEVDTKTSATKFSPYETCTRAQTVTFLYRDLAAEWEDYET